MSERGADKDAEITNVSRKNLVKSASSSSSMIDMSGSVSKMDIDGDSDNTPEREARLVAQMSAAQIVIDADDRIASADDEDSSPPLGQANSNDPEEEEVDASAEIKMTRLAEARSSRLMAVQIALEADSNENDPESDKDEDDDLRRAKRVERGGKEAFDEKVKETTTSSTPGAYSVKGNGKMDSDKKELDKGGGDRISPQKGKTGCDEKHESMGPPKEKQTSKSEARKGEANETSTPVIPENSTSSPDPTPVNIQSRSAPSAPATPSGHSSSSPRVDSARGNTIDEERQQAAITEDVAAELIDSKTDQQRLKATLQDVLKTQAAVQMVDIQAEDKLKRERQRRNLVLYAIFGTILTAIIITASAIAVRKSKTIEPPTDAPSMTPTMAPTSRQSAVLMAVEEGFGESSVDSGSGTPQARAVDWLVNEDTTISFPIEDEDSQNFFNDRYATAVLAFSTHVDHWMDSTNWLHPDLSVCDDWNGLTCNDDGRVGIIDLANQNLTGTIPTEIGVMDNLDFLFLYSNGLTGTLPTELGNLGDVDFFYLNDNQLTGSLPEELSGLLDADDLFLFGNQLTGTIPESFGNLVDLNNLYLQDNKLEGSIPSSLSQLKQVKQLYLQDNALSGRIPSELGAIISLERLLLGNNSLTGGIPTELGSYLALEILTLHNNELSGNMPDEICALRDRGTSIDNLEVLEADCLNNEVNCTCCTRCW